MKIAELRNLIRVLDAEQKPQEQKTLLYWKAQYRIQDLASEAESRHSVYDIAWDIEDEDVPDGEQGVWMDAYASMSAGADYAEIFAKVDRLRFHSPEDEEDELT